MRNAVACSLVLGALVLLGPSAQAQLLKRWPLSRAGSSSSASALLGSEVASVCRELGLPVTVMERGTAPLVGALGGVIGAIAAEMLRDHGVDLRTGIGSEVPGGRELIAFVRSTSAARVQFDLIQGTLRQNL